MANCKGKNINILNIIILIFSHNFVEYCMKYLIFIFTVGHVRSAMLFFKYLLQNRNQKFRQLISV